MASSESLVDRMQDAFINCITPLITDESSHGINYQDETRPSIDHAITKFFDLARETEAMFLKQGASVAAENPEAVLKQEIEELNVELRHKDEVLNRYQSLLKQWQARLNNITKGKITKVPMSSLIILKLVNVAMIFASAIQTTNLKGSVFKELYCSLLFDYGSRDRSADVELVCYVVILKTMIFVIF